ncbi:Flp pilus assembly protein TadD [Sphingomonas sp. BE123]|jgi:Flp pilus assembly protein TadD|uniref:tetratricopeptide repeat protein n=1 Tax=unclassified Sphingomonas TaxID=196159 RepID=UPI00286130C7|nr:tetratricopeptide repeat protein [Sphingomonas sp. BE123]MDR6852021.1 Flp pilus assembly protein TadD [Sphingomonas sp. BE123]
MRVPFAAVALTAALALAPAAQAQVADQPNAHRAIAAGDYDLAERHLLAEQRIFPERPEVLLNLAAVYARTGRVAEARALYQQVLARKAVAMDVADGQVAASHVVAQRGLRLLDAAQMAGR